MCKKYSDQFQRFKDVSETIGEYIYRLHLYTSKGEALFKAIVLALSWFGGVYHQKSAVAYYIFSISIIMEYAVQLVRAKKFLPKLLPIILITSNAITFVYAAGKLLNETDVIHNFQVIVEQATIFIIGFDAFLTLLIEPPESSKVENTVSQHGEASAE